MKFFRAIINFIGNLLKAIIFISGINMLFSFMSERMSENSKKGGNYFFWTHGRIFYKKIGSGSPILIIHGFTPTHSNSNLVKLAKYLSTNHTVYSIDLLGFRNSDKPWITYTNYLYVVLIKDFIRQVIKRPANVIACGGSGLVTLQTNFAVPEIFNNVVLLNPQYEEKYNLPKALALNFKNIIDAPVIGTFLFNICNLPELKALDKEGRHVWASRITGHLKSSIYGRRDLIGSNVFLLNADDNGSGYSYGDISRIFE